MSSNLEPHALKTLRFYPSPLVVASRSPKGSAETSLHILETQLRRPQETFSQAERGRRRTAQGTENWFVSHIYPYSSTKMSWMCVPSSGIPLTCMLRTFRTPKNPRQNPHFPNLQFSNTLLIVRMSRGLHFSSQATPHTSQAA